MPGILKFASVAGNMRSDDAKIGGMVPARVHAQRQVRRLPAVDAPADGSPRVVDGDLPLAALEEDDRRDRREDDRDDRARG